MTLQQFCKNAKLNLIVGTPSADMVIKGVYCCDLLSHALVHVPEQSAWVTVMANDNTLAVAWHRKVGCVIAADGIKPNERMICCAKQHGVILLQSADSVFDTADRINRMMMPCAKEEKQP